MVKQLSYPASQNSILNAIVLPLRAQASTQNSAVHKEVEDVHCLIHRRNWGIQARILVPNTLAITLQS